MTNPEEQWQRKDCIVERVVDRDGFRVLHCPTRTERFVDSVRVESELPHSIDKVPAAGSMDERRAAIAVRFAWEDAYHTQ